MDGPAEGVTDSSGSSPSSMPSLAVSSQCHHECTVERVELW